MDYHAFTVVTSRGSQTLEATGDWFAMHAKILRKLGIEDKGPVASEAEALAIANGARLRKKAGVAQAAAKQRKARGK